MTKGNNKLNQNSCNSKGSILSTAQTRTDGGLASTLSWGFNPIRTTFNFWSAKWFKVVYVKVSSVIWSFLHAITCSVPPQAFPLILASITGLFLLTEASLCLGAAEPSTNYRTHTHTHTRFTRTGWTVINRQKLHNSSNNNNEIIDSH